MGALSMADITIRRPIFWETFQASDVGTVREVNEDSVLSIPEKNIWVVADGMGGYEAGNVASRMVVEALDRIPKSQAPLSDLVDTVEDELIAVNQRILDYSSQQLEGRMLGSTVVSLVIKGRVGICLWAGDSRLYRFRNKQLEQLSRDHSEVEEQVQQGLLTAEEARHHPEANVITRAIGASDEVIIDINAFSTQVGDVFLLCSDGLYNKVSEDNISFALLTLPINEVVGHLIQTALNNGADDNVSVILVKGVKNEPSNRGGT